MNKPKILAFAGSTRTGSFNKKLVKIAAQGAVAAGAEVTVIYRTPSGIAKRGHVR